MGRVFVFFFLLLVFYSKAIANQDFIAGFRGFESGNYPSAIDSFQKSFEDPKFILPDYSAFFIAKSYYEMKNLGSAEAWALRVIASGNSVLAPEAYILAAKCSLDLGKNKDAAFVLNSLLKKYPDNRLAALASFLLAESYKKEKRYNDAFNLYANIDLYYPLSPYAKKSRLNLLELKKKHGFKTPYVSAKHLYEKGKAFWEAKDYKNAAAMFNKLAKTFPRSSYVKSALYMTGLAEFETSDFTAAISLLERNIKERGPQWQNSYYYMGRAYGRRNNFEKAVNALQYFISLYPNSPLADNAYYYIGYYHECEKNYPLAVIAYNNLVKNYPKSALADTAFWRTGRIYYLNGNKDYARDYFAQAIDYSIGFDTPKCLYWWGKLTEEKNKSESAAIYQHLIKNFDHTFYAYRANERILKLGYKSPLRDQLNKGQIEEEALPLREKLLIEAGLKNYADFESKMGSSESYQANLGLLLNRQGEYYLPISIAEKKVKGAILKGETRKLPESVWKLAYPRGFWDNVENESEKYSLDPYLILALIREESRFNPRAISSSSARGLMQIISPTARRISLSMGMSYYYKNLYRPDINIKMGSYYLSSLIKRFNGNIGLALAGYNGGPTRVKKWIDEWYGGNTANIDMDDFVMNIPITETREYVEKVLGSYYQYKRIYD